MRQALEMLDCLVVGNEPAGIWLLEHLRELENHLPKMEKRPYVPLQLGYLPLGTSVPLPLPSSVAQAFGIPLPVTQTLDVVTPKRVFAWTDSTLKKFYPSLSPLLTGGQFQEKPDAAACSAIRFALRAQPEILGFAAAVWKVFGKSVKLHPELLVWNTLQLGAYGFWKPRLSPTAGVKVFGEGSDLSCLENLSFDAQGVTVTLKEGLSLKARHCILSVSLEELSFLSQKIKSFESTLPANMLGDEAHYPLTLSLPQEAIPSPLKPFVVYLDTEEIPDLADTWYVETQRDQNQIRLWVNAKTEGPSENILETMRAKLARFYHHLPFLEGSLTGIFPRLDAAAEKNTETDLLSQSKHHRMIYAPIHASSLNSRLKFYTPALKCFFPYPYGPLSEASRFARELLGRTHYKKAIRTKNALP